MTRVVMVIPAHGRAMVSRVCLTEVAWCCTQLRELYSIDARALVIADDENLNVANAAGLTTLDRPNRPLGRKWNDGYELAFRGGADYVMALGSDDWIDPAFVADQLAQHADLDDRDSTVMATRRSAVVSPDGVEVALLEIPYEGGDGVRLIPRAMLDRVAGRPTRDERDRGIDGGMRDKLSSLGPLRWSYGDTDPLSIVDFKTPDQNLTSYSDLVRDFAVDVRDDPWAHLEHRYPAELIEQARALYAPAAVNA